MTCYFRDLYVFNNIQSSDDLLNVMWRTENLKVWTRKVPKLTVHIRISFQQKNIKLLWLNCFKLWLCCCSVCQWCPTLCNPMGCSMPGFPVLHHLPEIVQTHVHWVGDAIQPSHPLSSLSPPAFSLSQKPGSFPMSQLFTSDGPKYWSFSCSIMPPSE